MTALTFFYIVELDFLQDSTDLNHLNCKIGKCQDSISDTLDMNDFEPVIHTPSIAQKGKSRRRLRERILSKQRRSKLGKAILLCTYTVSFHCRFCFAVWRRDRDIFFLLLSILMSLKEFGRVGM